MTKKIFGRCLSVLIAFAICFGSLSTCLGIFISAVDFNQTNAEKPDFNYLAFGASNMVGYGIHGYNFEYVYEAPFEKVKDNRYGYEMDTQGSYTTLISEILSENYNVNLHQVGMSSLRIEELHYLLDETYNGDSYTDTWLYDTNGDGVSANWYYGAAMYEWNELAKKGVAGYDHEPTPEELIATLKKAVQNKTAEADLITLDLGMNNFGTYMFNLLVGGMFSDDLNDISPEFAEYYQIGKEYVLDAILSYVGEDVIPMSMLEQFADTLAYALVGYCVNFDEALKEIYALNPDVDVVVVSIQNMMKGLEVVFPGSTVRVPFGDIFGFVIDAANLYTAVLSPYASRYHYAYVTEGGRAEFFLDEIALYNGDPSTLNLNMKDCFDVYDGTLYLETRIQQMFAVEMNEKGLVNIDASQRDTSNMDSLKAFHYGYHYGIKDANEYPVITWKDGTPLKDFINNGEAGKLSGEDKTYYDTYVKMLSVAYDVTAEVFKEGTKPKVIDFTMLGMATVLGVDTYSIVLSEINTALEKVKNNPNYEFDMDNEYPEGFFAALSAKTNIPTDVYDTAFTLALYMQFGGTVFSHPNANGYRTIANQIWQAYTNKTSGVDVFDDQMSVEYKPNDDSYFVAVGGMDYAEIFAEYLGLSKNQFGTTDFDNLDYSLIDKADLVSIGFDDGKMLDFMMNQLGGYLGNYFSVNVRSSINNTISSVLDEIGKMNFLLQFAVSGFKPTLLGEANAMIDEMLESYGLTNKTMSELDWSKLLDDEQLVYVEQMKASLKEYLIEAIGYENYVIEIDMLEWIMENGGTMAAGTPLESILSNPSFIESILGDSAVLVIEVPIVDAIVFSIESYLYNFVEYTLQTSELISYINQNHPNTKIMILGHFNPLKDVVLDMGSNQIDLGVVFEGFAMLSVVRQLAQFFTSENTAFVYLNNVETVYSASLNGEKKSIALLDLLSMFSSGTDYFNICDEGHKQIAEYMMRYINIVCDHVYSNCDDIICNECGYIRDAIEHLYGEWFEIKAADYENEGEEGRICSACGYKDTRPMPIKEKNDDGTTRDDDIVVKIDDPVYLSLIPVALALIGIIVVTVRKKKNSK